jgi:hypothetical protein
MFAQSGSLNALAHLSSAKAASAARSFPPTHCFFFALTRYGSYFPDCLPRQTALSLNAQSWTRFGEVLERVSDSNDFGLNGMTQNMKKMPRAKSRHWIAQTYF